MSIVSDDGYAWYLGATQQALSAGVARTYTIGEEISVSRHELYTSDFELLREVLEDSAFAGLQDRCMGFMRAAADAQEAFRSGRSTRDLTPVIRSRFDDLLSAFRRFVDRTPHALSQRYGSESEELTKFRAAASYEFDHEFAYRFINQLRNHSDHAGSPILRIEQSSELRAYQGVQQNFDVVFDSETLLASYRWRKDVRTGLEKIGGEFSAIVIVDALLHSCGRIHCKTLLSQEDVITSAIRNIRTLANEAPAGRNLSPVLMRARIEEFRTGRPVSPFTVTVVRTDLADVAEAALRQAREVVGSLSVPNALQEQVERLGFGHYGEVIGLLASSAPELCRQPSKAPLCGSGAERHLDGGDWPRGDKPITQPPPPAFRSA